MVRPVGLGQVPVKGCDSSIKNNSCSSRIRKAWQKVSEYWNEKLDMSRTWCPRLVYWLTDLGHQAMMTAEEFQSLETRYRRGDLTVQEVDVYREQLSLRDHRNFERSVLLDSELAPFLKSNRDWIEKNWTLE